MIEALAQADGAAVVQHIDAMRLQGLSPAAALDEMIGVLQHMAVLQLAGTTSAHEAHSPEVAALAEQMPPDDTQLLYSLCLHGKGELGLAPDEYAALTMLLLRLLAFRAEGSTQTPAEKKTLKKLIESVAPPVVARPVAATASTPVVMPAPTVAAPVIEPAPALEQAERVELVVPIAPVPEPIHPLSPCVDESDLGNFWYGVVQQLIRAEAINALTRELALQAILVERQPDRWSLLVSNASLMQSTAKDRLQQALQAQGYAVQLQIAVGTVHDSPAQRNMATAKARMAEAEASLRADPFVQSLMRDFGGKIVPGTIQPLNPTKENHVQ
jgi:DNA polymerase III subunit gamma/tau